METLHGLASSQASSVPASLALSFIADLTFLLSGHHPWPQIWLWGSLLGPHVVLPRHLSTHLCLVIYSVCFSNRAAHGQGALVPS